jgi:hypothetical protein
MDQINLAIQETNDLERMMRQVLDTTLSIFGCDRVWLMYPCDADTATWRVPMERTRPEYPGALAQGMEFPASPELVSVARTVLASDCPVSFDPQSEQTPPDGLMAAFGIQSMLCTAIYPKTRASCRIPRARGISCVLRSGASAFQAGAGLKLVTRSI